MSRIIIILFIFAGFSSSASAQKKQITMYKTFGGVGFEMDTLTLSPRQVLTILEDNPQAYDEFKRAKANSNIAGVLGFVGGFLIGVPLGTAVVGGDPEWGLAAAGGALILATIPFTRAFHSHAQNALEEYNTKFTSSRINTHLYFTGTGARIIIRF